LNIKTILDRPLKQKRACLKNGWKYRKILRMSHHALPFGVLQGMIIGSKLLQKKYPKFSTPF